MPIRSGGSYVLRGGEPVLVAHSGGTSADKPTPPAAVETSSADNAKKEKSDAAHTSKNAVSRT